MKPGALVTGASRGIGAAIAEKLAEAGHEIFLNFRSGQEAAAAVKARIEAGGGSARLVPFDVADGEAADEAIEGLLEAAVPIGVVVNNAAVHDDAAFPSMEREAWEIVTRTTLDGFYNVTRRLVMPMVSRRWGRIINVTSVAGIMGNRGQANYAAAKCGVVGLTNVLRLEGAKYNIKTNVLAPIAATRMTEDIMPPEMFEKLKPEMVTPVVLYMVSEQCEDSGVIVNAGAGYFSRSAMLTGPGAILSDGKEIPTPEAIQENWGKVSSVENPKLIDQVNALFGEFGSLLT